MKQRDLAQLAELVAELVVQRLVAQRDNIVPNVAGSETDPEQWQKERNDVQTLLDQKTAQAIGPCATWNDLAQAIRSAPRQRPKRQR